MSSIDGSRPSKDEGTPGELCSAEEQNEEPSDKEEDEESYAELSDCESE